MILYKTHAQNQQIGSVSLFGLWRKTLKLFCTHLRLFSTKSSLFSLRNILSPFSFQIPLLSPLSKFCVRLVLNWPLCIQFFLIPTVTKLLLDFFSPNTFFKQLTPSGSVLERGWIQAIWECVCSRCISLKTRQILTVKMQISDCLGCKC